MIPDADLNREMILVLSQHPSVSISQLATLSGNLCRDLNLAIGAVQALGLQWEIVEENQGLSHAVIIRAQDTRNPHVYWRSWSAILPANADPSQLAQALIRGALRGYQPAASADSPARSGG